VRIANPLLAGVAVVAVAFPAYAEEDPVPAESSAELQRADEIVVVGKSYGQEVGETVTPLKDVPNTITVIDREQIEANSRRSRMR
jgi:outer membrane receptor for ferric coprogen and ferric-rhodotorulic acid